MTLAWAMVALTITLTVLGQLIVKWQVTQVDPPIPTASGLVSWAASMCFKPPIILVFAMAAMAAMAWFVAMSRLPLSHTYPVLGLTFPLVLLGATMMLGESVSPLQIAGTAFVVLGTVLLGLSVEG